MRTAHELALLGLAHIALHERDQGGDNEADNQRPEDTDSDVGFEHGNLLDPVTGSKGGVHRSAAGSVLAAGGVHAAVADFTQASCAVPVAQVFHGALAVVAEMGSGGHLGHLSCGDGAQNAIEGCAASDVAASADRNNVQRLEIVAVVVVAGLLSTIDAGVGVGPLHFAASDGSTNLPAGGFRFVDVRERTRATHAGAPEPALLVLLRAADASEHFGHRSSRLVFWRAVTNQRFEGNLAASEIADLEHHPGRNAVVSHLRDATPGHSEMGCQRCGASALGLKPCFEIHALSLDDSKPISQAFSKPRMFMLSLTMDDLTQHRKKRLEMLIASPPYNGDRTAFIKKAQLSKGRISQLLDSNESFGERSARALAERLGLSDPRWFDKGTLAEPVAWPFALLTPEQLQSLSPKALEAVEKTALSLIEIEQRNVSDPSQTATVVAPRSKGFGGTQKKPTFAKGPSAQRSTDPRTPRKTGNG